MPHSDRPALGHSAAVSAPSDRGCALVYIPLEYVHLVWPCVAGLIEAAMRRGDLSSFASVATAVMAGRAQLWVAVARHQGVEERPSSRAHQGVEERPSSRAHQGVEERPSSRAHQGVEERPSSRAHQGVEEPSSRATDGRTRPDADRDLEIVAAAVTELQQTERRKFCSIVACGGSSHEEHQGVDARLRGLCRERPGGMARWLHLLAPIEDWARSEGCDAMRIMGRRGWSRVLPTYRLTRVVLEKEL